MKYHIEHDGVKRTIDGAFSICCSRKDLQHLIGSLTAALDEDFVYGWVDVHDRYVGVPDLAPIPWSAAPRANR